MSQNAEKTEPPWSELVRMRVATPQAEVERFAAAIGAPEQERSSPHNVPFSYPMRWMAELEVRRGVYSLVENRDGVFFIKLQTFEYHGDLSVDAEYDLRLTGRLLPGPARSVELVAHAFAGDGSCVLSMNSSLGFAEAEGAWTPPL